MSVPKSHPRYTSLVIRDKIVKGVEIGITSLHGLTAHGRGEAFDYLLGERTNGFAKKSIEAAAALLLLAKHPVISVNGNTAALVADELIKLGKLLKAPLEVNLFHASKKRERAIKNYLVSKGAVDVLLAQQGFTISHLSSNRKFVNQKGIFSSDVVFVPLEDGDRTEALVKNSKKVITVDLNPLSRTAQKANITIVDNIIRAMPLLVKTIKKFAKYDKKRLAKLISNYDNKTALTLAMHHIRENLTKKKFLV